MEKISKVKNVEQIGTWESSYGLLYKFEYEMEDGVSFQAMHKRDMPYNIGEEVSYQIIKENQFGKSGKIARPKDDVRLKMANTASFALSYAKDVYVAELNNGKAPSYENILVLATTFNDWLQARS